jgi:hypothetical protein
VHTEHGSPALLITAKKERITTTQAVINHSPLPTIIREKEHQKKNKKINGDQESVAGLT